VHKQLPEYGKPYTTVNGNIASFRDDLMAAWIAAGVGGKCTRCNSTLEEDWGLPQCPGCARERLVDLGCKCEGSGV
jgi:hypothetical protein